MFEQPGALDEESTEDDQNLKKEAGSEDALEWRRAQRIGQHQDPQDALDDDGVSENH